MTWPISTHRYPHPDEEYFKALKVVHNSAYAEDDTPYVNTQRFTPSTAYELSDILAKKIVDSQGQMDNAWWLKHWKENGL